MLKDPSQANAQQLDAALASLETRITTLLGRPIVQTPGELVVMKSSQLDGVQDPVRPLRNLGFVLPCWCSCCTWALSPGAGWRRRGADGGRRRDPGATLVVLLVRRLLGSAVVDRWRPRHSQAAVNPSGTSSRGAAPAGAVRPRDRPGFHRRGPPGRARPARHRRAPLPRTFTCATSRSPSTRSSPCCSCSGWPSSRDQQSRPGPGDPGARGAGRRGHRSLRRQTAQEFPPRPNRS